MKFAPWSYFKRNIFPYILAYSVKWTLKIILWTCKKEIRGLDTFIKTGKAHPCILMLWHNNLVIAPEILNSFAPNFLYAAFISNSRDGEPLAILTESYILGRAQRVPHNNRHAALHAMINTLREQNEIAVITPDGPRGPKYVLKPGVVMAAKAADAYVVPFRWTASKLWELNTWDGMKIPKPFSQITVTFDPAIHLPQEQSQEVSIDLLSNALKE